MMKAWLGWGVAVILALGMGAGGFLGVRALVPGRVTEAQPPPVSAEEIIRVRAEEARKPPFRGAINGITFKEQTGPADLGVPGCRLVDATPQEIAASPLNFTATYLPQGWSLDGESGASCQGRLVSFARSYHGSTGGVNIARWTMRAVTSHASIDRIQAREVAGKPALVIGPVPGEAAALGLDPGAGGWTLILVEEWGMTGIQGGPRLDELIKIAEGVR